MATGDPIIVEQTPRFGRPEWFNLPPMQGKDDILRFLSIAKERGVDMNKAALYLKARGLLTPEATQPRTVRELAHERVRQGVAQGGFRTQPLPEDPRVPEMPQTFGGPNIPLHLIGLKDKPLEAAVAMGAYATYPGLASIGMMGIDAIEGALKGQVFHPSQGRRMRATAEWREEMMRNANAVREDQIPEGAHEIWSEDGLSLLAAEMLVDPLTWIPVAGGGAKLLTAGGRRMIVLDLGQAVERGMVDGLTEYMTKETADITRATLRARHGQAIRAAAERQAGARGARLVEQLEQGGLRAQAEATATYGTAKDVTAGFHDDVVRGIDGEVAETINTHYDNATQLELLSQGQLDDAARSEAARVNAKAEALANSFPEKFMTEAGSPNEKARAVAKKMVKEAMEEVPPEVPPGNVGYPAAEGAADPQLRLTLPGGEAFQAEGRAGLELGAQSLDELEKAGSLARQAQRSALARLEVERQAALEVIGERTGQMMDAVSKNSKWFDDAVNAKVERAMARFDVAASEGGLKKLIDEKAREAVNGFVRRTLADESVPSSSAAAAIARITAEEIAARGSAAAGRAAGKGTKPIGKVAAEAAEEAAKLGVNPATGAARRSGLTTWGPWVGKKQMPLGFYLARVLDSVKWGKGNLFARGFMNTLQRVYPKNSLAYQQVRQVWPALYQKATGNVERIMFNTEQMQWTMARQIKESAQRMGVSVQELGEQLNKAFLERNVDLIEDRALREIVKEAGDQLDRWSLELIQAADLPPELANTIRENLGAYMHMSYAKHHVKDWAKRVEGTAIWDEALQWFMDQGFSREESIGHMRYLVANNRPATFGGVLRSATDATASHPLNKFANNIPGPVLDQLKRRKKIPEPLQRLMGLEKDFLTNFEVTSSKMVHDINMSIMDREIIKGGLETGIFTLHKTPNNTAEVFFPRVFSKPLYTTKETAWALGSVEESTRHWATNLIVGAASAVKFGKVALSPPTIFRNAISLVPMMISNGTALEVLRHPSIISRGGQLAYHAVRQRMAKSLGMRPHPVPSGLRKELEFLISEGLVGSGGFGGELKLWQKNVTGVLERQGVTGLSRLGKMKRGLSGTMSAAADFYVGLDDLAKVMSYKATMSRFERMRKIANAKGATADFGSYMQEVFGAFPSEGQMEKVAAEYTRSTIQHFPYASQAARFLSQNPMVSPFATFAFEMPRTQVQTVLYGAKEVAWAAKNAGSPFAQNAMRSGMMKLGGVVGAATMFEGARRGFMTQEDLAPERQEAVREMVAADWQKNSDIYYSFNEDGTITINDPGYMNPFNDIRKLWVAAISRPGTLEERMTRFAQQLEESFLGREILLERFFETVFGKKMGGGGWVSGALGEDRGVDLQNPQWTMGGVAEALYYFMEGVAPGGVKWLDRYVQQTSERGTRAFGLMNPEIPSYEMTKWQLVRSFFGFSSSMTIDPAKSTYFKFANHLKNFEDMRKTYRSQYRKAFDVEEKGYIDYDYERLADEWSTQTIEYIEHARTLGVTDKEIKRQLQSNPEARLSARAIRILMGGNTVPFRIIMPQPKVVIS